MRPVTSVPACSRAAAVLYPLIFAAFLLFEKPGLRLGHGESCRDAVAAERLAMRSESA